MGSLSILGAGNMGFRLGLALTEAGETVEYVWNRTEDRGQKLVRALRANGSEARFTPRLEDLAGSEILILAVSDDAIPLLVGELARILPQAGDSSAASPLVLHTSGATSYDVFRPLTEAGFRCGVFYPLMTLSRNKNIDFKDVPFLFESPDPRVRDRMAELAFRLRSEYMFCDSAKRLRMHAAAVFSCNFVNYILGLAFEVAGNSHTFLIPATLEMVRKSFLKTPWETQTGPAIRGDRHTVEKHLALLHELGLKEEEEVYRLMTQRISERFGSAATGYWPAPDPAHNSKNDSE